MKSTKIKGLLNWYLYGLVLLCSIFTTFIMLPISFVNIPKLKPGDISPVDIRSPISIVIENKKATDKLKEEAAKNVKPVFLYNPKVENSIGNFTKGLRGISPEEKKLIQDLFFSYYKRGIISKLPNGCDRIIIVTPKGNFKRNVESFLTKDKLKNQLEKDLLLLTKDKGKTQQLVNKLLPLIQPNYIYSQEKTEALKEEAESKVKPIYIKLQKGEVLVKKGEKITPEEAEEIKLIKKEKNRGKGLNKYISLFLLSLTLFYVMVKLYGMISPSAVKTKNIVFSFSVVILDIFLIRSFTFFSKLLLENLNVPVDTNLLYVPIFTSTIFASMFITKKIATIHILPISIIPSFLFPKPEYFIIPVSIGTVFSCFDSREYRSREIIYKSAFTATIAMAVLQSIVFIYHRGLHLSFELVVQLALTLLGALVTAIVVNGLIPFFTNTFKFTTDMVYMELMNLNHPLLRKLALKAPGTYSHSVMVATLAEAAAEAIGANALLAKAGGLFHDIGKIKNPQAFIENQVNGINIHDKLPPEKSAAILRAHVEYGEELGKKYGLPAKVIDIIKEHHGTTLMNYFYHKAQELHGSEKVDDKEFRYPGPKPQFKEAGIVMLADTIEAAVRAAKDKNVDTDKLIHKLIMEKVEDGQLNQSGLSLRDIATIERVFKTVLAGAYHNRIEYPDDREDNSGN